jgi:hypothetical protein
MAQTACVIVTAAGPSEGQVAEFVENNEVHAREVFGNRCGIGGRDHRVNPDTAATFDHTAAQ